MFAVMFVLNIREYSHYKLSKECWDVKDAFESCDLYSIGVSPEEHKGTLTCVCVQPYMGEFIARKVQINSSKFWFRLWDLTG